MNATVEVLCGDNALTPIGPEADKTLTAPRNVHANIVTLSMHYEL
jgi:hypothetical protein